MKHKSPSVKSLQQSQRLLSNMHKRFKLQKIELLITLDLI